MATRKKIASSREGVKVADKLKVGDKLWWVPNRGEAGEVVVKKVGRKWATVSRTTWGSNMEQRIDFRDPSMPADSGGYSSPGRCWRTKEEYQLYQQRLALWGEIRAYFAGSYAYQVPAHLDGDDLESILQALMGSEE